MTFFLAESLISVYTQGGMLRRYFPDSTLKIVGLGKGLIWEGQLKPTDVSILYTIKIEYNAGNHPNVYVTNPNPLQLAKSATKLKHVYDHDKQHLCLYHKLIDEWNEQKLIVKTIVPWASEWLLHYEIWVATGIWHGGGIH